MSGDPLRRGTRWPVRRVPPELERAYVDGGWWTDDTLGAMVARQLARHPASTVAIWSRSRPWQGSYADIDDEARRLVTLLRDLGVQPGEAVAFQLPNWREAVVSPRCSLSRTARRWLRISAARKPRGRSG